MNSKICTKCNIEKDFSNFHKAKLGKFGLAAQCKLCIKEKDRLYYQNNSDNISQRNKEWCKNNQEKVQARIRKWSKNNREKINKRKRNYYKNNSSKINDKRKQYHNRRSEIDPLYRLKSNLRKAISKSITQKGYTKKSKTYEILGCSYKDFKSYIESKFEPWMSWSNYGKYNGELNYGFDIDHKIPLASAKTEEDILKLNHYTNLQPLCSYINRVTKSDKMYY